MFSTHGNMAFHQGDINDAAINIDIKNFPKPTEPASFSVGNRSDTFGIYCFCYNSDGDDDRRSMVKSTLFSFGKFPFLLSYR